MLRGVSETFCRGIRPVFFILKMPTAKEGVRLTSFYVGASLCTPRRTAFLAGCYPARSPKEKSAVE